MDYGMLCWKGSNQLKAREKNQPAYVCNIGRETENYGRTCISKEQFCSMEELVPRIRSLWHFEGWGEGNRRGKRVISEQLTVFSHELNTH